MIPLTIAQLTRAVRGQAVLADGDSSETVVSGTVDTDSRLIARGDIFVAKPGEETDGHLFVGAAAEAGASVAIVEHPVEGAALTQIVVPSAVDALADLARTAVEVSFAEADVKQRITAEIDAYARDHTAGDGVPPQH